MSAAALADRSCVTPVRRATGDITTIEGLDHSALVVVQDAWLAEKVPQCGYCRSGQIMAAVALLGHREDPDDTDIALAIADRLCRHDTYPQIRKAIKRAAEARKAAMSPGTGATGQPDCQSVDDVARFLADPHNFQIVAEEENRLVSSRTMMYRPWNDSYELGRGLTRPDCHRRGLGALLMQRVVDSVCDAALGEVFIASVRARCLVDPRTALNPPMIVAGRDTDRIVANGAREPHLITLSIPEHARFVHVTPPVAESVDGTSSFTLTTQTTTPPLCY